MLIENTDKIFFRSSQQKIWRQRKIAVREILFENKEINLDDDTSQILERAVQMGYGIFTLGGIENSAV